MDPSRLHAEVSLDRTLKPSNSANMYFSNSPANL